MERDKYFSNLLYSICEGLNSFFSSKNHKKICLTVKKKPYLSPLLKNGSFANEFRTETDDGKVLPALCKYSSKVEYIDFM